MSKFSCIDKSLSFSVVGLERLHEVGKCPSVGLVTHSLVDRQNLLEPVLLFTCHASKTNIMETAFSIAGLTIWNALPESGKNVPSTVFFKRTLAVDMKFYIHIHTHIDGFYVDIHRYIHGVTSV